MRSWNPIVRSGALLLGLVLAAGVAQAEDAGTLLSASGDVRAQGPAGERALEAGDALATGERLVTGSGATAALASGDFWVQLGAGSSLRVREDGRVELDRGTVRVVDLEDGGGATLLTPHAAVRTGIDSEVEAAQEATTLRQGDGTARVVRRDATGLAVEVPSGREARIDLGGITVGEGVGPVLALTGAEVDVAVSSHFQPADVAAPPSSVQFFPFDPDKRTFNPCQANGCGGAPQVRVRPSAAPPQGPPGFGFGTGPADPPGFGFGTGPADRPGGGPS